MAERDGRGKHLPAELSSFVGRGHELAEIQRLLAAYRLVTLTGVGGVGKTRLAQRLSDHLRRGFPDGAWFVDLTQIQDPELLTQELQDPDVLAHLVTAALGLRERSAQPPLELLSGQLAGRRLLLVLDNCEHLLDPVAMLTDTLLRSCPELRILATSREALSVAGEVLFTVPALATPEPRSPGAVEDLLRNESVALFTARATAAWPEFQLTPDNAAAVAEICRRLDGLPLAVELAAVRIRALAPQQILDRLADRFGLLRRGSRTAAERQQTLRACIDWSFGLCPKPERKLWAGLSVFSGSFELDAVEGVCASDTLPAEDLLDLTNSLIDKSVLSRETHGSDARYRMLETIRAYGEERLRDDGDEPELRRRYRDWYEDLVLRRIPAEWISDRQVYWLARLEREHPNLRATIEAFLAEPDEAERGLRVVVGLPSLYWWGRGLFSEGRRWLDVGLARATGATSLRARALLLGSRLAFGAGDAEAAYRLLAEGERIAERLDDAPALAFGAFLRGTATLFGGEPAAAVDTLERALSLLSEVTGPRGDPGGEDRSQDQDQRLHVLFTLAAAAGLAGDHDRARACTAEVLRITEPRGEVFHRSSALWARGLAAWSRGDLDRATADELASLRLKHDHGLHDPLGTALCLEVLAWTEARGHRPERSAVLLGAAASRWTELGTSIGAYRHLVGSHDDCCWTVRDALGEVAFQEGIRRGRRLTRDAALAYTLDGADDRPDAAGSTRDPLSRREREVAELVALGRSNREIARHLVISQRTAEGHINNIMTKLGFRSRTQIAAWVIEQDAEPR
jgi:predicted ATPase/DNA-binding CsgD family transcriptional regulator